MTLTLRDNDPFDYDLPIFRSGAPVNLDLNLSPQNWNACPEAYSLEVQLVQHYALEFGESSLRVVSMLWSEVINASGTFSLNEAFVPPAGSGTYAFEATARDEQGNVLASGRSDFFHVQQVLNDLRPAFIAIYSPYNGQAVEIGNPLFYTFTIEAVSGDLFKYKVEVLDDNHAVIRTIDEELDINVLDANLTGHITMNIPGKYTFRVTTSYFDPVTFMLFNNVAFNEFTVEN